MRIKSRGIENVQKIFPTWIVGSFARRLQPNTAEVLRSRFSKNRGRIFYAQKYFLRWLAFLIFAPWKKTGEKKFESGSKNGFLGGYHLRTHYFWKARIKNEFSSATTWRATRETFLPEIWTKPLFRRLPLGDEKVLWRFFHKRLNFTPLKFRISERCFSDRWFFARKCPNR